jgi:hypothetical protein
VSGTVHGPPPVATAGVTSRSTVMVLMRLLPLVGSLR